jgi:RNA polymerase sigma-70 factor (ECF subfamily)
MLKIDRAALCSLLRRRGMGDDAEDLVQELWVKAARVEAGPEIADSDAYLARMAANLARDHRRAALRRAHRERDWSEVAYDREGRDEAPLADRRVAARQRLRAVAAILATLDPRSQAIFRRFRIEGASQAEIAAEEGMTVSGVQKRLHQVYRSLDQFVSDEPRAQALSPAAGA